MTHCGVLYEGNNCWPFWAEEKPIICLGRISVIHVYSSYKLNRERRELQELQKKFMDNVSVGILSSFLVLSGCGFEKSIPIITTPLLCQNSRQLATLVIILVAIIFSSRHGDQLGRSFKRWLISGWETPLLPRSLACPFWLPWRF